jgi:hypothetical protein
MILEGTDALSRGIWMSPLHGLPDAQELTQSIFDPLPFDRHLVDAYVVAHGLAHCYHHYHCNQVWDASTCFGRMTVWFPPPELAHQVLVFMLETWAEQPLTTSALFFVPRAVPAFWWGLSRYLVGLPMIYPHKTPLLVLPKLPIPICALYLPPPTCVLSQLNRLDQPAVAWVATKACRLIPLCFTVPLPTVVLLLRMVPGRFRANRPITLGVCCLWVLPSRRVARIVEASLFLGFVTGLPLSVRRARSVLSWTKNLLAPPIGSFCALNVCGFWILPITGPSVHIRSTRES